MEQLGERINVPPLRLPGDELFKEPQSEMEQSRPKPGQGIGKNYYIEPPKSPNDLLEDSDTEYAIETGESLSEEKAVTKIPIVKNRQKNFMNKKAVPFSERHLLTTQSRSPKRSLKNFVMFHFSWCILGTESMYALESNPNLF